MRISDWSSDVCSSDLRGRCWRGRRCRAGSIRDFAAEVTDQAPEAAGKALRDRAATPTGAMTIEFDHHYGLLVRQMLCDVELGFALVECDGQRPRFRDGAVVVGCRSEEHTSELQSLMRISYAVFCLEKKKTTLNL